MRSFFDFFFGNRERVEKSTIRKEFRGIALVWARHFKREGHYVRANLPGYRKPPSYNGRMFDVYVESEHEAVGLCIVDHPFDVPGALDQLARSFKGASLAVTHKHFRLFITWPGARFGGTIYVP